MATINLTLDTDKIRDQLSDSLKPMFDKYLPVVTAMAQDELAAWLTLAKADTDAAAMALLDKLTDEQMVSQTEADSAQLATDAATAAALKEQEKSAVKEVLSVVITIIGGLLVA